VLERLRRDLKRSGSPITIPNVASLADGRYLGADDGTLYLEERTLERGNDLPHGLAEALAGFIADDSAAGRLAGHLVVLQNDDFNWFARYALSVQARNVLDENKKSKNLWYEESLPPDTLMYSLLGERTSDSGIGDLKDLLTAHPYLQTGGNETVGHGWFHVKVMDGGKGEASDEH
jgi:CRISPR-associated protein Cmr4